MQVGDTTEHANFVIFDKEEEKLIKVSGTQLSDMKEEVKMIDIGYFYNEINSITLH